MSKKKEKENKIIQSTIDRPMLARPTSKKTRNKIYVKKEKENKTIQSTIDRSILYIYKDQLTARQSFLISPSLPVTTSTLPSRIMA